MADLKSLTVTALRELARKHIGPGYSRLKTKSELVRALDGALPASVSKALEPERRAAAESGGVEPKSERQPRAVAKKTEPASSKQRFSTVRALKAKFTGRGKPKAGVAVTDSKKSTGNSNVKAPERAHPSAQVEDRPPLSPAVAQPVAPAEEPAAKPASTAKASRKAIPTERAVEEETVEALAADEKEAEAIDEEAAETAEKEEAREPLEAEAAEPKKEEWVDPPAAKEAKYWDSQLGELPDSYGEDTVVLLPKDPFTVMAFWDFSQDTRARAFAHLHWPHAKLRLYDEERGLVRETEFALEARRWYVFNLEPGRKYHVELVAVGAGGETRRIGPPSNAVGVPPKGPSPIIDDRFIRIPFDTGPRRIAEGFGDLREFASWAQARAQETEGSVAPETDQQRDELYKLSGGLVVGSSEQMANWAAGGEQRGGSSAGGMYSGQWPWSGILPRRTEQPGT